MIDTLELGRAIYEVECKLEKIETKLNNVQNLIYELLEKVEAIGVNGGWNNEFRAKYGLPLLEESEEDHD
jgi:hypothetical protein